MVKVKKNKDLVDKLIAYTNSAKMNIKYQWINGHNGNHWNELVDQDANQARINETNIADDLITYPEKKQKKNFKNNICNNNLITKEKENSNKKKKLAQQIKPTSKWKFISGSLSKRNKGNKVKE